MRKLKSKFTKWYIRKGYRFNYVFNPDGDFFGLVTEMPRTVFTCPWWVRPLLIFFSPSVYGNEYSARLIVEGFMEGLKRETDKKERSGTMINIKFHEAFKADAYYRETPDAVHCRRCGTRLKTYYAEERLYAVKCGYCETITLVKASNPTEAALYVGELANE